MFYCPFTSFSYLCSHRDLCKFVRASTEIFIKSFLWDVLSKLSKQVFRVVLQLFLNFIFFGVHGKVASFRLINCSVLYFLVEIFRSMLRDVINTVCNSYHYLKSLISADKTIFYTKKKIRTCFNCHIHL